MEPKIKDLLSQIEKLKDENQYLSEKLTTLQSIDQSESKKNNPTDLQNFLHTAMSKQRDFLYTIIDTVPNHIYVKSPDGKYVLANKATADFFGTTVKDIIDKTDADLIKDERTVEKIRQEDQQAVLQNKSLNTQCEQVVNHDNKSVYLRTKKVPLQFNSETPNRILGVSTDITELINNEVGLNYLNESLTKIYNSVHDAIALVEMNGKITDVNERMLDLFEITYHEALQFQIYPDYINNIIEYKKFLKIIPSVLAGKDQQIELQVVKPKSKDIIFIELFITKINLGTGDMMLASINDITEIKKDREIIDKLSLAVKQSPASVIITDKVGRIEYVNPKFSERSGYSYEEAVGQHSNILKSSEHDNEFYKELWQTITKGDDWHGEICNQAKSGSTYWESVSISPILNEEGKHINYVAVLEDISEKKKQAEKIEFLALHDVLTKLPNRNLFMNRMELALERAKRNHHMLALMFIDLDGFKSVNDTFGHKAGDSVLIESAKRIIDCHRKVDTTARIGGDEFVTILEDISNRKSIEIIAKRIIKSLNEKFDCDGQDCTIGCSIGISIFPNDTDDIEMLIKNADSAMYYIKNSIKNSYCFFEDINAVSNKK